MDELLAVMLDVLVDAAGRALAEMSSADVELIQFDLLPVDVARGEEKDDASEAREDAERAVQPDEKGIFGERYEGFIDRRRDGLLQICVRQLTRRAWTHRTERR